MLTYVKSLGNEVCVLTLVLWTCLGIVLQKARWPLGAFGGVQRVRSGRRDPEPGPVFSQLSGAGGSSNNNNMCWDHTLCSGDSLGTDERPMPQRNHIS